MPDLKKFGTKEAPGTAVITRKGGSKEFFKDGKLVRELDPSG
ncbi:unnamed protein product, partial [marine sediment metagenome]